MQVTRAPVHLLEGSFATHITTYVGDKVDGDPLWSSRFIQTNPSACVQVHRDYIRAGSKILKTNTYQASVEGFKRYLNLDEKASLDLIKESVNLIKEAIELECKNRDEFLIAGAVGPYGASLRDGSEYRGDYMAVTSADTLVAWHTPQIEALLDAGVDLLSFDTIPALAEAEVLLKLIAKYPRAKAFVSFSTKDFEHISNGEKFADVAEKCWSINPNQIVAIGANCLHPANVAPLLKPLHDRLPQVNLLACPNSGERFDTQLGKWMDKDKCIPLVTYLPTWLEIGVRYVGCGCRTGPEDIAQFRRVIDSWCQQK